VNAPPNAPASRRRRRAESRGQRLDVLTALQARGLPLALAATGIGVHVSTAVRWRKRALQGEALVHRRGRHVATLTETARAEAAALVKEMHALIGADALRHSVPGLSRREAARIKTEACREMERDRRAEVEHVIVSAPGVLRGFDAMELCGDGPRTHALIAADGCVPYRTSWTISGRYDGTAVEGLLQRDFEVNGAPLVLRMDRATQHRVPAVDALLAANKVLPLHGPPHYAPYYGQLERQNREHRAWLAGRTTRADLDTMMAALNAMWRRSTLRWRTAAEAWAARPMLDVDRDALAEEVNERAERLRRKLDTTPGPRDLAWRLAVKQVLTDRGLLRVEKGGWC
jgi:hypothetical protein